MLQFTRDRVVCIAAALAIVACDSDSSGPGIDHSRAEPPLGIVAISPGSATLVRGDSVTLIVSSNMGAVFSWFSADSSIAVVRASSNATTVATVIGQDRSGDVAVCAGTGTAARGCVTIRVLPD